MAETVIPDSAPNRAGDSLASTFWINTRRSFAATVRREGFGIIALLFLILFIIGPISSVFLWAFAERWQYPSLIPTQWGFKYWTDTLSRPDILAALPVSIVLSLTVTALAALICLPAAY